MSAVWVVRDGRGGLQAAFPIEARAIAYDHRYGGFHWTVTRETLLTPEMAAVIAAAKVLADIIGLPLRADSLRIVTYPVVDSRATHRHTLADCAVTICFHNGVQEPNALTELLSAVATLREQEGA